MEILRRLTGIANITLGSLLLTQAVLAAATAPVAHSHAGRQHTHPLPAQGVPHRHGNSAPGQINAPLNPPRPGTISGTLNQAAPPLIRPAQPPQVSAGQAAGQAAQKTPPHARPLPAGRFDKADSRCPPGAADCNVCAINVRQQFNRAAAGQIDWHTRSWRFAWNKPYPPQQVRPVDIFAGKKKYLLGIPDKHIQGFVRTYSKRFPFAGSHSHRSRGGIFRVRQNQRAEKHLATLQRSHSRHPSGVHVLGQYLAYGEQGQLHLQLIDRPAARPISFALRGPKANFGGGIGLVKLIDGSHLMITTGPGGQDQRPRLNRFYHLKNRNGQLQQPHLIHQSVQESLPQWPTGFRFAENLSLVTECGSGAIYAVHTTGDETGMSAINGNGYWRLSQLVQQGRQLRLTPVSAFMSRQNMSKCSLRAAATVHVNPARQLEFYCHGYAKDPKGSTLNVLGKANNKFRFTVGIPR